MSFNVPATLQHPGLDAGNIAALGYANQLAQLPVGFFVTVLSKAIYPTLAEQQSRIGRCGWLRCKAVIFDYVTLYCEC